MKFLGHKPEGGCVVKVLPHITYTRGYRAVSGVESFGEDPIEWVFDEVVSAEDEFAQVLDFTQQPKYKNGSGDDFVAEFARDNSPERFQGAMIFIIEKYLKRLGKKDDIVQELYKVADYANRFYQIEKERKETKGEK